MVSRWFPLPLPLQAAGAAIRHLMSDEGESKSQGEHDTYTAFFEAVAISGGEAIAP